MTLLIVPSDAASLSGEKGTELVEKVWHDILTSLSKDVPEVPQLAKAVAGAPGI